MKIEAHQAEVRRYTAGGASKDFAELSRETDLCQVAWAIQDANFLLFRLGCQPFRGSAEIIPLATPYDERMLAEDTAIPDLCIPLVKAQV